MAGGAVDFEDYVRARLPDLVRFTTALCADRGLAEDVVQNVLVRVHGRWDQVSAADSTDGYVRRALVNEYLSWRRKWARIIPHETVPERGRSVADHAGRIVDRDLLVHELTALPPRQRAVLVLRYYGGFTDAEIAETLGCRPVTVRGYASRALATLRVGLGGPPGSGARPGAAPAVITTVDTVRSTDAH